MFINNVIIEITFLCKDLNIHLQLGILLGSGIVLYALYFNYNGLRSLKKKSTFVTNDKKDV